MGRPRKPLPLILKAEDVATGQRLDIVDDFTGKRIVGKADSKPRVTPEEYARARRERVRANAQAILGLLPPRITKS